jgi:hypothetical protein
MKYLKRHPFPVVARFDRVVAVSFAFPKEILRPMVPAGLEIDGYEGFADRVPATSFPPGIP